MADKFSLKYRRLIPAEKESAAQEPSPAQTRSYLHNHRMRDALQEYVEQLDE